jgi:cathepsin L
MGPFKISDYVTISNDCTILDTALTAQPLAVMVDARNFYNYKTGAFSNCGIFPTTAALLVGGSDSYYRLKLNWGTGWGEQGYIRLKKSLNVCGICTSMFYPKL